MTNKESLIKFAKVACLMLFVLIVIISGAAVWNAASGATIGAFEVSISIVNFIIEIIIAVLIWKKYIKE